MKINQSNMQHDLIFDIKSIEGLSADKLLKKKNISNDNNLSDKFMELEKIYDCKISDSDKKCVEQFINKDNNHKSRWNTVKIALQKDIPLTQKNLDALHNTLNEKQDISEVVEVLTDENDSSKLDNKISLDDIVEKYEQSSGINHNKNEKEHSIKDEDGHLKSADINKNNVIKNSEKIASKNIAVTDEKVDVSSLYNKEDLSDEQMSFLNEMDVRLTQSINYVISNLEQNPFLISNVNDVQEVNDLLSDTNFRTFLKTEITEQAYNAREYFEKNRQIILKNLEMATTDDIRHMDVSTLARTIDKLDSLITSNEMSLFLDMKMERDILKLSSNLQMARTHLEAGKISKVVKIINSAKDMLQSMKFMPDEKTIELRAFQQVSSYMGVPNLTNFLEKNSLHGARNVLSYFRYMGINHEAEWSESVLANVKRSKNDGDFKNNLKAVLLGIKHELGDINSKKVEIVENQLNNLTGQQLFNKLEPSKDIQNLFFHIPIKAQDEIKDMSLYVQSRKKGDKMDWENCSLYFSIDLKKYGNTGIHILVQERVASIAINNEDENAFNIMHPILEDVQRNFSEIGFRLGKIQFNKHGINDNIDDGNIPFNMMEPLFQKQSIADVKNAKNSKLSSISSTFRSGVQKGFELSV